MELKTKYLQRQKVLNKEIKELEKLGMFYEAEIVTDMKGETYLSDAMIFVFGGEQNDKYD